MEKDNIKIGKFKHFAVLLRDECLVFNSSMETDIETEYLYFYDLEKGVTMNTSSGPIVIEKIKKTENDLHVAFAYHDYRKGLKRAYISLGQEIKIRRVIDNNPDKYIVSNCSLMITTKEYANKKVNDFYEKRNNNKTNTK